jgi:hypothetical protein
MFSSASVASRTMLWLRTPLMCAMKPTPQLSFSFAGSYRPCFFGSPFSISMLMALDRFRLERRREALSFGSRRFESRRDMRRGGMLFCLRQRPLRFIRERRRLGRLILGDRFFVF